MAQRQLLQQVGRGRKRESRAREGGEERSRQVREGPAGTEQQLVFVSEGGAGGQEERKGHIHTLTMGMDDKRMTVFVYNTRNRVPVWMDVTRKH